MEQYWFALEIHTEEGWLAVERHFPQGDPVNRYYATQAKLRLAELYRETDRPELAMQLYVTLAEANDEEPQLVAQCLMGQANLHSQQKETTRVTATLSRAVSLLESLPVSQRQEVLMLLDSNVLPELEDPILRRKLEAMLSARGGSTLRQEAK